MATGLSASGARIRGDNYQHLFTWSQVLRAINGTDNITKIGIEDPEAGNVDDVTVYLEDGGRECYQVKYSVDASRTAEFEWLIKPPNSGGPSMIQRFYELWAGERGELKPKITLVTNRLISDGDLLLSMIDGDDDTAARRLQHAKPGSKANRACCALAKHLNVTKADVVLFLHDVQFVLGKTNRELTMSVKGSMREAGLRCDGDAVDQGIGIVRGWVASGRREITTADLRLAVKPLKLPGDSPTASILVQMIDREPVPEGATVVFDWVDSFPGSEPRVRRLPSDPALWNTRFRPEFRLAAQKLRSQSGTRVLVRGHMRLPTWFAVGVELSKAAGFEVSSFQGQTAWSSVGEPSSIAIKSDAVALGPGRDLAVGISLASDLSPDVLSYVRDGQINVGNYVCMLPPNGASNQAIGDAAEARGWAFSVRDSIRGLVSEYKPDQIHLFLSGPHGAMLLLGHLWDRMPRTQLYEDLGSAKGYSPSYLIPA